jgi:tetratricopeptide (TPR) repeat protein/SAM-dependent methyltransferase
MAGESGTTPFSGSAVGGTAEDATREALALYKAGDFARAKERYEQVLAQYPDHADALHMLGILMYQTGACARAVELLHRAIANDPASAVFHNNLGKVLEEQGALPDALAEYEQALRLEPRQADGYFNLGVVLQKLGRLEEAQMRYREALRLRPHDAECEFNLGNALSADGRLEEAADAYRRAVRLRPDGAEALTNLGNVLHRLGSFDEALEAHRQALRLRPLDPLCHNHLGNDLRALGQSETAVEHYHQALRLEPGLAEVQQNLGNALLSLGQAERALAAFAQALRINPQLAEARQGLLTTLQLLQPDGYRPDIEELLSQCYRSSEIVHQPLARISANQLRCKHGLAHDVSFAGSEGRKRMQALANDELLRQLLRKTVNVDPVFEPMLTEMRRLLLLEYAEAKEIGRAERALIGALALQCFNNEYVFNVTTDEQRILAALRARWERAPDVPLSPAAGLETDLLLLSLYLPFYELANAAALAAVATNEWCEPLQPLIERTLKEPLEERAIEKGIECLGDIDDPTSQAVREQYEENPYPRWVDVPRYSKVNLVTSLRRAFPHLRPPPFLSGPIKMLVAGCGTGQEPIRIALARENVELLALDLSRRSLAYGVRMARKLALNNIRFVQGDILQLHAFGGQFHVIECAGVLHHMEQPIRGWRVLVDKLVAGGLMKVGLYSDTARKAVAAAREYIREQGLAATGADIKALRTRILRREVAPTLTELVESEDFYTLSSCRDLLFHAREHRFTLPRIRAALEELGLAFVGLELPTPQMKQRYRQLFPQDPCMTDLSSWQHFEQLYPAAFSGMYMFWCQKTGSE